MRSLFKNIVSFILPITVIIIVPLWIEDNFQIRSIPALIFGILFICVGLVLMALSIRLFIKIGKGTLAPWSPTHNLVIVGLYRYVRNPMIIGVLFVLIGKSLVYLSKNIALWTITFFIINNIYFVLYEEPGLEKRFGKEYLDYKRRVKRWIPRSKPYAAKETKK